MASDAGVESDIISLLGPGQAVAQQPASAIVIAQLTISGMATMPPINESLE